MKRYITPSNIINGRIQRLCLPECHIAIVCFQGYSDSMSLVKMLAGKPFYHKIFSVPYFAEHPNVFYGKVSNQNICIVTSLGTRADVLIEELSCIGINTVVGIGAAGSIDEALKVGNIVAVTEAIANDGTSRVYGHKSLQVDKSFIEILEYLNKCCSKTIEFVKAATVEALYRETEKLIIRWRKKGAQIINMEVSPLYASSLTCGLKSVWLGYVSDILINKEWKGWYGENENYRNTVNQVVINIIEECIST